MPSPPKDVRAIARKHTAGAIKTLVGIMNSPKAPAAARVTAASTIIDRGWGKADQNVDVRHTVRTEPMSRDEWVREFGADLEPAAGASARTH